jgi:transcriptional regulator with XRE-family HTH domain
MNEGNRQNGTSEAAGNNDKSELSSASKRGRTKSPCQTKLNELQLLDRVLDFLSQGYSQLEVAKMAGSSQPTVSRIWKKFKEDYCKKLEDRYDLVIDLAITQLYEEKKIKKETWKIINDKKSDNKTRLAAMKQLRQNNVDRTRKGPLELLYQARIHDWRPQILSEEDNLFGTVPRMSGEHRFTPPSSGKSESN